MARTVAIVQARMGSTRLLGKVLLPLNGHTVLEEVLSRCWRIPLVDEVVCATTLNLEDDAICETLEGHYRVERGSELDVLGRYYQVAKGMGAEIIMRVTADCPHISPKLCNEIALARHTSRADYASNLLPRTFPKGLDCEVFTFETLERAHHESQEREHVTPWMQTAAIKRVNIRNPWTMDGRLTLDTYDDYRVICAAFECVPYERLRAPGSLQLVV